MTERHQKGKTNLLVLVWMGLGCQLAGVLIWLAAIVLGDLSSSSMLKGVLFLIFGMALGGWASNLREIVELKERVSQLENQSSASPDSSHDG